MVGGGYALVAVEHGGEEPEDELLAMRHVVFVLGRGDEVVVQDHRHQTAHHGGHALAVTHIDVVVRIRLQDVEQMRAPEP